LRRMIHHTERNTMSNKLIQVHVGNKVAAIGEETNYIGIVSRIDNKGTSMEQVYLHGCTWNWFQRHQVKPMTQKLADMFYHKTKGVLRHINLVDKRSFIGKARLAEITEGHEHDLVEWAKE
jgi:hypothetical protein